MAIGISEYKYIYEATTKLGQQKGNFRKEDHTETNILHEKFKECMDEMYERIQSGNIHEHSYQIGDTAFTEKEWNKILENFDDIEEDIRTEMRMEHEKRRVKLLEKELGIKETPGVGLQQTTSMACR